VPALETFSVAAANFPAAQWLADDQARQQHLFISWYESIASISSAAGAFGVLKHPSEESHGRDHFITKTMSVQITELQATPMLERSSLK
jgi:hypothetical protein